VAISLSAIVACSNAPVVPHPLEVMYDVTLGRARFSRHHLLSFAGELDPDSGKCWLIRRWII